MLLNVVLWLQSQAVIVNGYVVMSDPFHITVIWSIATIKMVFIVAFKLSLNVSDISHMYVIHDTDPYFLIKFYFE